MRRISKYCVISMSVIMIALLTTACGSNSDAKDISDLQQYKTDYVGDSPNVVNIVSHQDYPKGYTYDHIEIQSEAEPYGLMVYLKVGQKDSKIEEQLQANADTAFDLIGNLGVLEYLDADSEEIIASFES